MEEMKELIKQLNEACDVYYNKSNPTMSDYEFDNLYSKLVAMENENGITYANSPTQNVGNEVKSELEEVKHNHPMLSLDKCHDESDLIKFAGDKDCVLSVKCDGLTTSLRYLNGKLVSAETRGDGVSGSNVLHNVLTISNVPQTISYLGELIVDGETVIDYNSFAQINESLPDEDKYKHPRNLASASLTLLDSAIAAKRKMKFINWKVIKGFDDIDSNFFRLKEMEKLGFDIVPMWTYTNKSSDKDNITDMLENLKDRADNIGLPMDGAVMSIDSISYGNSLGTTGKFPRHSIAYKFEDELYETVLESIEWNTSKTGLINPIAKFQAVDLGGAVTTKATLHNISYIKGLQLGIGDTILVRRANGVIPKVHDNLTRSGKFELPTKCPICDGKVEIHNENGSETLYCTNSSCKGKLLGKLTHFVSKNAMNIDNLSEATLEKFITMGWLNSFIDIYYLQDHIQQMSGLEGFGIKSVTKLISAIDKSRNTTLDRFIYSMSIPLIGRTASKTISKYFNGDFDKFYESWENGFDWTKLDDFGSNMNTQMRKFVLDNDLMIDRLAELMTFEKPMSVVTDDLKDLSGLTFVITGSVNHYSNREELKVDIETRNGKVSGSVSAKTSYLINNDIASTSGKNKDAKKHGVTIITEEQFMEMIK